MKQVFLNLFALLIVTICNSQSPEKMNYQSIIRNSNNELLTNKSIGMEVCILKSSITGEAIYAEIHNTTSNSLGLINIEIGTGTSQDDFSSIDWASDNFFIKIKIDPEGGKNYTITSTSQLISVPYAMHSKTVEFENDPIFDTSLAAGITKEDTAFWNSKLNTEVDGDMTNEIQNLSSVLNNGVDAGNNPIVSLAQITIGSSTPTPSTSIDASNSAAALLLPKMSTAKRDSLTPTMGMMVYNTEEENFQGYIDTDSEALNFSDTGSWSIPRTLRDIVPAFVMYQSITAFGNYEITMIDIMTNADTDMSGLFSILEGDGIAGSELYSQDIVYSQCAHTCTTRIVLDIPFKVTNESMYT